MKKKLALLLIAAMCMTSVPAFALENNTQYGVFTEGSGTGDINKSSGSAAMLSGKKAANIQTIDSIQAKAEFAPVEASENAEELTAESGDMLVVEETADVMDVESYGYTNCVIPYESNIDKVHYYANDIEFVFQVFQFGGAGEEYYIYVLDEDGNIVADFYDVYGTEIGYYDLYLTLEGPNEPGNYWLGFESTYPDPEGLDQYLYPFSIIGKPAVVNGLKASTVGPNTTKLTWNKAEGAEGYLIYGQKNGKYGYVGMTSSANATTYTDKKATGSEYNFYWVFAYVKDSEGKMYTNGCAKYAYAKGVCLAPTNFKAASVKGGVKLTWNASENAEGYLIYGIVNNQPYGYVGMTKGTTFTDKKASTDIWSFYWVFPYHTENGKMVTGYIPSYVWGRAK